MIEIKVVVEESDENYFTTTKKITTKTPVHTIDEIRKINAKKTMDADAKVTEEYLECFINCKPTSARGNRTSLIIPYIDTKKLDSYEIGKIVDGLYNLHKIVRQIENK